MPDPYPPEGAQAVARPSGLSPLNLVPVLILITPMWIAMFAVSPQEMYQWGISAEALREGRYETLLLSMFAHGGLFHIGMNSLVCLSFGGVLVRAMGGFPFGWLRFFVFFGLAGLCGSLLYVAINPSGFIPAIGASGAISGLIGMVARANGSRELMPAFSREMGLRVWDFVKANIILVVLFAVFMFLSGGQGGIAWEAHLGGFLFGMFAAEWFWKPAR